MKTALFSANAHDIEYFEARLIPQTASLAAGYPAVCVFVNDRVDRDVLRTIHAGGTRLVALRCAGFNNVDLAAAEELGVAVVRVPSYSPNSVAEHTLALILTLDRKIHRAVRKVREGNFSLDGLLGFDLCRRTVGIVGTGRIGEVTAGILRGFGCEVLVFDPHPNPRVEALGARYVALDEMFRRADIISLHCPLTPSTRHLIDAGAIARMKRGVMIINTSRGALVDTQAVIDGLKSGHIGFLGLDVYEEEADLFFEDLSATIIQDDAFMRLLTFPNVVVTGHQAFFTEEALTAIAETTLESIRDFETGRELRSAIRRAGVVA